MVKKSANIFKIISLSVTIILAFTGYIVANDRMSRTRDYTLEKCTDNIKQDLNDHVIEAQARFAEYATKQQDQNTKILVLLEGVSKDIEYIKKT